MKCEHPGAEVVPDILQAESPDMAVSWCRRCGAYRRGHVVTVDGERPTNWAEWVAPGGSVLPKGQRGTLESAEVKAREVGRILNGIMPPGWGYVVILASFGEADWCWTYISSIDRGDTIALLREAAGTVERRDKSL